MIELGEKVRDKVSGFEGIVTSRAQHLNGSNRCAVTATSDSVDKPSETWLEESRLELITEGAD